MDAAGALDYSDDRMLRRISALAVVVVGVLAVASAQTRSGWTAWGVDTVRDEFDGTESKYVSQLGDDKQLRLIVLCAPTETVAALAPGPAAKWRSFANSRVDLRFDDGPAMAMEFTDAGVSLLADRLLVRGMIGADIVTVRVNARQGPEVDTFDMTGLVPTLEAAGCKGNWR